jgi:hypothetical protein
MFEENYEQSSPDDDGSMPLPNDPVIVALDHRLRMEQERSNMLSGLDLSFTDKQKLHHAFIMNGTWPLYFLTTDPNMRQPVDNGAIWSEEDRRALLLVKRTLPNVDLDAVGHRLFPTRTEGAASFQYKQLL